MAIGLRITDGTTTVTLAGDGGVISGCTYGPQTASRSASGYEPVQETAEVVMRGSQATIRARINELDLLFEQAAQRAESQMGPRVFVEYRPVASDAYFRSELSGGRVVVSESPGLRRFDDTAPVIKVAVIWERAHWWEGARVQVPLTNGHGTDNTSGLTIYNKNTATHDNWVEMDASDVTGALPTPVELRVTNTTGGSVGYRNFYFANNTWSSPATFVGCLQGENRNNGAGTVDTDSAYADGEALIVTVASGATTNVQWELTAATMAAAMGRPFRVMMRLSAVDPDDVWTIRTSLLDSTALFTLYKAQSIVLELDEAYWHDLGTLPLPAAGYSTGYGEHTLQISVAHAQSTSKSIVIDDIVLMAADNFRHIHQWGQLLANSVTLVDDGIEQKTYATSGGSERHIFTPTHNPIEVWPGRDNRITILQDGVAQAPAWTSSVRAYIRPRRLTV